MAHDTPIPSEETDLVISRVLRAPRAKLWRAWTDPALLQEWWCPKPWTTEVREFDMRPGGNFGHYAAIEGVILGLAGDVF